jgi:hypothetical protein
MIVKECFFYLMTQLQDKFAGLKCAEKPLIDKQHFK